MAVRVYSPNGEPFDIPRRDVADKLILQDGWTQTAPVKKSVEPSPKKRHTRRKKATDKAAAKPTTDSE